MAKGYGGSKGSKGPSQGGMPPSKLSGGVNTGTFHGKHDVAHPIQGKSGSQTINHPGSQV